MNLSEERRNALNNKILELKKFIQSCPRDKNTNNLLTYLSEIEKDIKGKKYGLVFEEHKEAIDEILENNVPVLKEDEILFINNGGQMNFLIEGDNLASLQLLEKTHKGKIDLIYIDPPYNTGSKDWKYNNDYVDDNDTFRHSKWLSMMSERLSIAKTLLKETGIIVCAIDRYELTQLGMLMSEIFGENNKINIVTVVHKPEGRNQEKFFGTSNEFAIFYAKNKEKASFRNVVLDKEVADKYKESDDKGNYRLQNFIRMTDGRLAYREVRPKFWYPIYVNLEKNIISTIKENVPEPILEVYPKTKVGIEMSWKLLAPSAELLIKEGDIVIHKDKDNFVSLMEKLRETQVIKTHWIKKEYNAIQYGSKIVNDLFGEKVFDFPKSLYLMVDIIKLIAPKNGIVLDFFAGSGTTGHAVLNLNAEDGGNRKFILCTNNENNICRDVTYERIKRVIEKEDYKASLKYMKVDFVPITDKFYYEYADELLKNVKELVELENAINFNGNKELAIILTEEELDEFESNIPAECKTIYLGHDILPTQEQEDLFKKNKIKINIIPDYYYRDLEG